MFAIAADTWELGSDEILTFSVEIVIFLGFLSICFVLILLQNRYPNLTKNGWIELIIAAPCLALKGLFDGLDTVSPDGIFHDIFDSLDAITMVIGLILLGTGLFRIALYSAEVWEVR
jgi:hypothetical protein